jgi:hypothetical protein
MAKYDSREVCEVPDFYMPFSYDAVMALVYAANGAVKNNITMWSDGPGLLEALKTIKYTGLTGEVSFTESLDRRAEYVIRNFQGSPVTVGKFMEGANYLVEVQETSVHFIGGLKKPPLSVAAARGIARETMLSTSALVAVVQFMALICLFAVGLNRNSPVFKVSSPVFLAAFILGCMSLYTGIILAGQEKCAESVFALSIGFTMVFSSFLAKVYRIHTIFNSTDMNKKNDVTKKKMLRFFAITCIFELVLNISWLIIAPPKLITNNELRVYSCDLASSSDISMVFLLISIASKVMLMLANVYFALRVSKVNAAYNESKVIGLSVYSMSIFMLVLLPIAYEISGKQPTLAFIIKTISVVVPTTTSLAVVMSPKLYLHYLDPVNNTLDHLSDGVYNGRKASTVESGNGSRKGSLFRSGTSRTSPRVARFGSGRNDSLKTQLDKRSTLLRMNSQLDKEDSLVRVNTQRSTLRSPSVVGALTRKDMLTRFNVTSPRDHTDSRSPLGSASPLPSPYPNEWKDSTLLVGRTDTVNISSVVGLAFTEHEDGITPRDRGGASETTTILARSPPIRGIESWGMLNPTRTSMISEE